VVGDDVDGEEDAVLGHHGVAPRGGEGIAWVSGARDAVTGGGLARA
jgi:hypothetical protein